MEEWMGGWMDTGWMFGEGWMGIEWVFGGGGMDVGGCLVEAGSWVDVW